MQSWEDDGNDEGFTNTVATDWFSGQGTSQVSHIGMQSFSRSDTSQARRDLTAQRIIDLNSAALEFNHMSCQDILHAEVVSADIVSGRLVAAEVVGGRVGGAETIDGRGLTAEVGRLHGTTATRSTSTGRANALKRPAPFGHPATTAARPFRAPWTAGAATRGGRGGSRIGATTSKRTAPRVSAASASQAPPQVSAAATIGSDTADTPIPADESDGLNGEHEGFGRGPAVSTSAHQYMLIDQNCSTIHAPEPAANQHYNMHSFRTHAVSFLWLLCVIALFGHNNAQPSNPVTCNPVELAKAFKGFCISRIPNGKCCGTVYSVISRGHRVPCLCRLMEVGVKPEDLISFYYKCGGNNPTAANLPLHCTGAPPPPGGGGETLQPWSVPLIIAIVVSALAFIALCGWIIYYLWSWPRKQLSAVNQPLPMNLEMTETDNVSVHEDSEVLGIILINQKLQDLDTEDVSPPIPWCTPEPIPERARPRIDKPGKAFKGCHSIVGRAFKAHPYSIVDPNVASWVG